MFWWVQCIFLFLPPADEKSVRTEVVAQLVRASVCGTEGRGFETPHPPWNTL